jgi:hypothetical protein
MGRLGSGAPQRMICAGAIFGCGRAESFRLVNQEEVRKWEATFRSRRRLARERAMRADGKSASRAAWMGMELGGGVVSCQPGESLVTKLMRLLVSHSFWVILWCFKSRLLPSAFRRKSLTVSSFGILMPAASAFSYQNMLSGIMQAHVMSPSGRGASRHTAQRGSCLGQLLEKTLVAQWKFRLLSKSIRLTHTITRPNCCFCCSFLLASAMSSPKGSHGMEATTTFLLRRLGCYLKGNVLWA